MDGLLLHEFTFCFMIAFAAFQRELQAGGLEVRRRVASGRRLGRRELGKSVFATSAGGLGASTWVTSGIQMNV